ncbi:MAG: HAD-IIIC family phosphatase [Chryseotalea sp. WA131a]|nr:MAG: HAD-IIIC family phosphatase [Chryseotalea sp. WA131a]
MFDRKWIRKDIWRTEGDVETSASAVDRRNILATLHLTWEIHCVECAMPTCYSLCTFYSAREDGNCERSAYGIYPNRNFVGHYNYGADIRFRKWAKVEAKLADSYPVQIRYFLGRPFNVNFWSRLFNNANRKSNYRDGVFDEFLIECFSTEKTPFKLIFEHFEQKNELRQTRLRTDFTVSYGHNRFSIPFRSFALAGLKGYIHLCPEDTNTEKRIIFTWLDFVKFRKQESSQKENRSHRKIKCIAWDLDNTMWRGILIEDQQVFLNPESVRAIKLLDARGIIQTIVSKNNYEPCWEKIKEFKLDKYFVLPEINWDPKSKNLLKIVKQLNIGMADVGIIDDSPFERDEIKQHIPEVNIYTENDIQYIPSFPEFDVIVSEESKNRRIQYLVETNRVEDSDKFAGSYESFLISCAMHAEAFIPEEESQIRRCFELVQRSNQLNLSTIRYSESEFRSLLKDRLVVPVAINCKDRYGNYGIVGFSSLRIVKEPYLENFVISCRVAQKMVEYTFIKELCLVLRNAGFTKMMARLVTSAKNGPLIKVFQDLPFMVQDKTNNVQTLKLELKQEVHVAQVMSFKMDPKILEKIADSK